jgi:hypothetical protein
MLLLLIIFYEVDNFCKQFESEWEKILISDGKRKRNRKSRMTLSEIMTIAIFFHHSNYKHFKHYYINHVMKHLSTEFPRLVSYNRFVELMQKITIPLAAFMQFKRTGTCTEITFIDSTPLAVSHPRRIHSHKTFKESAKRGKTSVGWFFGFKLHLAVNDYGEILSFLITPGNTADNNEKVLMRVTNNMSGKIFGDKGYIIKPEVSQKFHSKGIRFITKPKKNMKKKKIPLDDMLLLNKRSLIETIIGLLKESFSLEHSRHRSAGGFFSHVFSTLIAYTFMEKKPSIKEKITDFSYVF